MPSLYLGDEIHGRARLCGESVHRFRPIDFTSPSGWEYSPQEW